MKCKEKLYASCHTVHKMVTTERERWRGVEAQTHKVLGFSVSQFPKRSGFRRISERVWLSCLVTTLSKKIH